MREECGLDDQRTCVLIRVSPRSTLRIDPLGSPHLLAFHTVIEIAQPYLDLPAEVFPRPDALHPFMAIVNNFDLLRGPSIDFGTAYCQSTHSSPEFIRQRWSRLVRSTTLGSHHLGILDTTLVLSEKL